MKKSIYVLLITFLAVNGFAEGELDVDKQVCPAATMTPDRTIIDNSTLSETLVDHNRELKDLGTEIVVKEFFNSKDTLFNFMKVVYQTIDDDLKDYRTKHGLDDRAVFFLFKGGNVMRLIANGVFALMPPEARDLLQENYADIFKRSDADFSVFVDDQKLNGLDYETALNDLAEISYQSLNKIRVEFSANPEKYFNFSQLKSQVTRSSLGKYFARLKDLGAVADQENPLWRNAQFSQLQVQDESAKGEMTCAYEGQRDMRFDFDGNDETKIIATAMTDKPSWIQNTLNRTLKWPSESDASLTIKFYLVRAKIVFEYAFTQNGVPQRKAVNGELIDVSFPHRDDFRLRGFLDNYDSWVTEYKLRLEGTDEVLTFKAESIEGITADIAEILFEQRDRPWSDKKYVKRISRLFFFGIADMLKTHGLGSQKSADYVAAIKENLLPKYKNLFVDGVGSADEALEITTATDALVAANSDMTILNEMLEGTAKLISDKLVGDPKDGDVNSFEEYVQVIEDNLEVIAELAKMQERAIDTSKVYDATMDKLL